MNNWTQNNRYLQGQAQFRPSFTDFNSQNLTELQTNTSEFPAII
jgi:hypothetical protein